MTSLTDAYNNVKARISMAQKRAGRSDSVMLVAVSKTQSVERMNELSDSLGRQGMPIIFGENYIQEFVKKVPLLHEGYQCHYIGRLQSNKVKDAVKYFDVIESVDSLKLLEVISKEAERQGKVQEIFVQVNISKDPHKSGILEEDVDEFVSAAKQLGNVKLTGLMTITELYSLPEMARKDFRRLALLREKLNTCCARPHLSMGMSQDFEIAVEEGASVVRVGTAIFGER